MDDNQFRVLLERMGYSWKGYRKVRKGVRRRIHRHMQEMGCPTAGLYLEEMEKNPYEKRRCERYLTVSISRFFRDRKLWEVLGKEILPSCIHEADENVRVWSAGCACGEEPYSVKILWHEQPALTGPVPGLRVLATDMNPIYVERAKKGVYPLSSLKELPQPLRRRYFNPRHGTTTYKVVDFLKEGITWEVRNLFSEPTKSHFSIIFLRNSVLTYYEEGRGVVVLQEIVDRLAPGGILIIGSHEKLPPVKLGLVPYGSLPYVFQREPGIS